jgi:hypothetical protein
MKTQATESSIGRFATELQNVSKACLNHQFEAMAVNCIVQEALQKIVNDSSPRDTLSREFLSALSRRGRKFAVKDVSRTLELISEMRDHAPSSFRPSAKDHRRRFSTGVWRLWQQSTVDSDRLAREGVQKAVCTGDRFPQN